MPAPIDLAGRTVGRLTVLHEVHPRRTSGGTSVRYWQCRCACGTERAFRALNLLHALRAGREVSCGCRMREEAARIARTNRRVHRWTPEELALLGALPDAELAERIGLDRVTVRLKRRSLNVPAHKATATRAASGDRATIIAELRAAGSLAEYARRKGVKSKALLGRRLREAGVHAWSAINWPDYA